MDPGPCVILAGVLTSCRSICVLMKRREPVYVQVHVHLWRRSCFVACTVMFRSAVASKVHVSLQDAGIKELLQASKYFHVFGKSGMFMGFGAAPRKFVDLLHWGRKGTSA